MSWFGIKTVFSQLVKGTQPTINGKPVEFEVWLSPSFPAWTYQPGDDDGPFRLIRVNTETHAVYGYVEAAKLAGLVTDFAAHHMPVRQQACFILDRHCMIVIGWLWNGSEMDWDGCEYAFGVLAVDHPVDAAIWERRAFERQEARQLDISLEEWIEH